LDCSGRHQTVVLQETFAERSSADRQTSLQRFKQLDGTMVWNRLRDEAVIAVLTVDRVAHAVPLARALVDGGIGVLELTMRTPVAVDAVREIQRSVPEAVVGMGTITSSDQATDAAAAGAAFGVAPGLNPQVVRAARDRDLPFMPGIVTPSEIERAVDLGCRVLKFFPAEASGGLAYLNSMAAPYDHLDLRYVPLGGIHAGNLRRYLDDPRILAVGGTWIASRKLIAAEDWTTITANARQARTLVEQASR
jgi:2-dehydro-3-deoxyphosphogluconate aldolase / (4S)-4-hydroxy-2-oxoglutarate aldolase